MESNYQVAETLRKNKQYAEAYAIYASIRGYKDVDEIMANDVGMLAARRVAYQVGSYVAFGSYPQTESGSDNTPIEWLVLESDGETALLISRYALDCQPYNTEQKSITWENCTLRGWLNGEFYNRAFNEEEKRSILTSDVSADKNPVYNANPGNATKDNVFLLSSLETGQYFVEQTKKCASTDYACKHGAHLSSDFEGDGKETCYWWLRSPGDTNDSAGAVGDQGANGYIGVGASIVAVRPCVRVRLFELQDSYEDRKDQITECIYQIAENLRKNQQYTEAYAIYATIQEYKDVNEIMTNDAGIAKAAQRAEDQTGNYVTFGSYPQTKDGMDDTPIEWLVLESDGETALLISRYALDCQPYNTEYKSITWENCTLRSWLNDEFYNRAFSAEEKQYILTSDVSADKASNEDINPGNATRDHVFLLSSLEVSMYEEVHACGATDYAIQQGAYTNGDYVVDGRDVCCWWLRTPGSDGSRAARIGYNSGYIPGGNVDNNQNAVRPCVRVRLS